MNNHSRTTPLWWYIVIALEDASEIVVEELGQTLIELGAGGTVFLEENQQLACYLQATIEEKESFLMQLDGTISVVDVSEVQDENWTALCEELWQEVQLDDITIVPVIDDEAPVRERASGEIFLIPGTGFGTGHHGTTAGMVQLLHKQDLFDGGTPAAVLDVGTGSAILSLVVRERFPSAKIDACDICPQALENAKRNLTLNSAEQDIHLQEGSIDCYSGCYDLLMANIFPEVLCSLAEDFLRRSRPNGLLLLSGIMREKRGLIRDTFDTDSPWELCEELLIDDWYSIAYKRRH